MHAIVVVVTQLAQAPSVAPVIPFWLQVSSVALAPMLGFAGIAVGAHLKDRSDRLIALAKERRELYSDFLDAIASVIDIWANTGPRVNRRRDSEGIDKFTQDLVSVHHKLTSKLMKIDLIGSQRTVDVAHQALDYMQALLAIQMKTLTGEWDREEWQRGTSAGSIYMRNFRNAAIGDLYLPRRDRKKRKVPDYPQEWQNSLKEYMNAMANDPKVWEFLRSDMNQSSENRGGK